MATEETRNNIAGIVAVIVAGGSVALDLFLKLARLMELGPDEQQNILNLVKASDTTDDETITRADAWMKEHFPNG